MRRLSKPAVCWPLPRTRWTMCVAVPDYRRLLIPGLLTRAVGAVRERFDD